MVYDEPKSLVEYYRTQSYSPLSVHVFLRDILLPVHLDELGNFRPVPNERSTWEHQDVMKWPDEDRKRFNDSYDRLRRIARIQIRRTKGSPKLLLRCWRGGPIDQEIKPNGDKLTLQQWWGIPEKTNTEDVHPAFWREAMKELALLLKGKAVCQSPTNLLLDLDKPLAILYLNCEIAGTVMFGGGSEGILEAFPIPLGSVTLPSAAPIKAEFGRNPPAPIAAEPACPAATEPPPPRAKEAAGAARIRIDAIASFNVVFDIGNSVLRIAPNAKLMLASINRRGY